MNLIEKLPARNEKDQFEVSLLSVAALALGYRTPVNPDQLDVGVLYEQVLESLGFGTIEGLPGLQPSVTDDGDVTMIRWVLHEGFKI